jgi:peptidoglycan-associated lipoprotein
MVSQSNIKISANLSKIAILSGLSIFTLFTSCSSTDKAVVSSPESTPATTMSPMPEPITPEPTPAPMPPAPENPPPVEITAKSPVLLGRVYFDFDQYDLRQDQMDVLKQAVSILEQKPTENLRLEGNTDSMGSDEYNLALGQKRASAVRDYLVSQGIASSRLKAISYGKDKPLVENDTDEGRQQNRRTDMVIAP